MTDGVAVKVVDFFVLEPVGDFAVGGIYSVRSVTDVATHVNTEVSTDGATC